MMRTFAMACLILAAADAAAVDTVLHNGKIWTGDPTHPVATALAVDEGRLVAIGDDETVLALATTDSQRIDLKGHRVVPGINDAHTHLTLGLPGVGIDLPRDADSVRVREAIAALPTSGDTWISADIDMAVLHDSSMRRAQLDALQPTRPLFLTGWTGHGMLINSAAQRALGLSPDQVPAGGWLGRDASGAFDGRVYEYAQWSPRARLAARPERLRAVLARDSSMLLKLGVTSIQNMAIGTPIPDFIAAWQEIGSPLRVRAIRTPLARKPGDPPDDLELPAHDPARPMIILSGTKWILDGTPMERGAAMRAAYPEGGQGRLNFSPRELEALLTEIFARRDQPLLHVSGDATLIAVLDAMQAIGTPDAWRPLRPRIEHGEGLAPDLIVRAATFGIVLVQNPSHFMLPPTEAIYLASHRLQPLADVLAAGVPLALGSDGPPSPWLNMMFVTNPVARADQALTREQVLRAYTHGSAFAEFSEDDKGMLALGRFADLAVLSQDVLDMSVPAQALPGTASLLTMVGGKIAWRDPSF